MVFLLVVRGALVFLWSNSDGLVCKRPVFDVEVAGLDERGCARRRRRRLLLQYPYLVGTGFCACSPEEADFEIDGPRTVSNRGTKMKPAGMNKAMATSPTGLRHLAC